MEAFRRTERKLAEIFLTKSDILLMQGEAVLGLEAAARGLVLPGTPVLNLVSGVFGKGMGYWLKDFGAELHELEVPYNDSVDPADVERYLDEHPEIDLRHGRPLRDAVGDPARPGGDRPDRARARRHDHSSTASPRSAGSSSAPTTGRSTSPWPRRRSASAARPASR